MCGDFASVLQASQLRVPDMSSMATLGEARGLEVVPVAALNRLAVISQHVAASATSPSILEPRIVSSQEVPPAPGGGPGLLSLVDNRTGKKYEFEISDGGTLKATDFQKVRNFSLQRVCMFAPAVTSS